MSDLELTWRRSAEGTYLARCTDDAGQTWGYEVGREPVTTQGSSWYVSCFPVRDWAACEALIVQRPADVTEVLQRGGFSSLKLAKHNALATRCQDCYRYRPLHELKLSRTITGRRGDRMDFFRCLERDECEAIVAVREAEERAALVHLDHQDIYIRDTEYGPELVFVTAGLQGSNAQTIQVTEADLDRLGELLAGRKH
jgi:hypothetical protein